jgi:hypothetical protein
VAVIRPPDSVKRYHSAKARFLKPALANFFARECPRLFGPVLREKLSDELIKLFEALAPETSRLKPGQLLWNALDKHTRGDSPQRRYVPVVVSVICEEDVELLTQGVHMSKITERSIVRMIREAYQQGGILSSRDIGLITLRQPSWASSVRRRFEARNGCTLPHTGALHDMGSTVSHKATIIRKVVLEKKDPATVARECHHSQAAVDRYLKDYHRIKTLYQLNHDVEFIQLTTRIAKHVIIQYITIIEIEKKSA